jgi:hypothetical protein
MIHSFINPDCDAEQWKRQLVTITLSKSSNKQVQKIYAEAYVNACNAVKLDMLANYTEARDSYRKVIQVFITSSITRV